LLGHGGPLSSLSRITLSAHEADLDQPWFYPRVDRETAIDMLRNCEPGTFLLRPSSKPGCYAISFVVDKRSRRGGSQKDPQHTAADSNRSSRSSLDSDSLSTVPALSTAPASPTAANTTASSAHFLDESALMLASNPFVPHSPSPETSPQREFGVHSQDSDSASEQQEDSAAAAAARPSSSPSTAACATQGRKPRHVSHKLIYCLYPGFTLEEHHTGADPEFWSLSELVQKSPFLSAPLLLDATSTENMAKQMRTRTVSQVVGSLATRMESDDVHLTEISWTLEVIDSGQLISQFASHCERRSNICFAQVECTAPDLLPLRVQYARCLMNGLRTTTHLRRLIFRGHDGMMHRNFTPNLDDDTVELLVEALLGNRSVLELDLCANRITNRGACALAKLVCRRGGVLTRLHLRQNFIRTRGLITLAQALRTSAQMELLDVAEQLTHGRGGVVVLHSTAHVMALQFAIHHAIDRRSELLLPLPCFHGFLERERAEQLVLDAPVAPLPPTPTALRLYGGARIPPADTPPRIGLAGRYLLYLDRHRPGVLMLAVTTGAAEQAHLSQTRASPRGSSSAAAPPLLQEAVLHRPIYRLAYGFSFYRALLPSTTLSETPPPLDTSTSTTAASSGAYPALSLSRPFSRGAQPPASAENSPLELRALLPSLQDHCLWLVCSSPELCELALQYLPDDLREQLISIRSLLPLWGVQQVPGEQRNLHKRQLAEEAEQRQHLTSWRTFSSNTILTDPLQHSSSSSSSASSSAAATSAHVASTARHVSTSSSPQAHVRHLSTENVSSLFSPSAAAAAGSLSGGDAELSRRRSLDRPLSRGSTSTAHAPDPSTFHISHQRVYPKLKTLVQRNRALLRTPVPRPQVGEESIGTTPSSAAAAAAALLPSHSREGLAESFLLPVHSMDGSSLHV